MVYSDTGPRRFLTIALILLGIALLGYLFWGDQIREQLSQINLRGQVTPVEQPLMDYLQLQPGGVGSLDLSAIGSLEDIEQQMIETLLIHDDEFDTNSVTAAQTYLRDYYAFLEPIPDELNQIMQSAAQRYIQASDLLTGADTTEITPFVNDILTILANHRVATNNYQAVQRSQSTRLLLERLIEEL